jgi:hypothetical protein
MAAKASWNLAGPASCLRHSSGATRTTTLCPLSHAVVQLLLLCWLSLTLLPVYALITAAGSHSAASGKLFTWRQLVLTLLDASCCV